MGLVTGLFAGKPAPTPGRVVLANAVWCGSGGSTAVMDQVLILSPMSPQMISATLANRNNAMDSPNRMIPAITVPTAPTPVQMA